MADARPVRRLPGYRDLEEQELAALETAVKVCRRRFALRGYGRLETPGLEETELFLRKSGGELASRLCRFTDPAGYDASLRPEFTAPVLRHVIENGDTDVLPLRIQYSGPVFRYAAQSDTEQDRQRQRQFTQAGAELLGGTAPRADGEVLAMALDGLQALGIARPTVVLGHVGLLWDLLHSFGLSERARLFLVNRVGDLRRGADAVDSTRSEAVSLGILIGRDPAAVVGLLSGAEEESLALIESVLHSTVTDPARRSMGVRAPEEIVSRLAKKLTAVDDPSAFDDALGLLAELATVRGPLEDALEKGRAVVRGRGRDDTPFEQVAQVAQAALDGGVPEEALLVDFGLARGIAYYTGMVFDLRSGVRTGQERTTTSLGGGGRYDGLPRALGAEADIPALGFAYDLEAVVDAAPEIEAPPKDRPVVVAATDSGAAGAAARHAAGLRRDEGIVLLEIEDRPREELSAFARARGAAEVTYVSADGTVRVEAV